MKTIDVTRENTGQRLGILRDTGFSLHSFVHQMHGLEPDPRPAFHVLRFCSHCGSSNVSSAPPRDNEPERLRCITCGSIHYRNPRIVVRCIAENAGRILLCQRAEEPRRTRWSTPGGYLEMGEDIHTAAVRETFEEVGVMVDAVSLAAVYEFPQINEIFMICTARIRDAKITLSHEAMDAQFFAAGEIPWNALAFPTDSEALHRLCAAPFGVHQPIHTANFSWGRDGRIMVRTN